MGRGRLAQDGTAVTEKAALSRFMPYQDADMLAPPRAWRTNVDNKGAAGGMGKSGASKTSQVGLCPSVMAQMAPHDPALPLLA